MLSHLSYTCIPCPGPIFGSQQHSFRRWLDLWLKRLSAEATSPLAPAFAAVGGVLKWDLPLMAFVLPYMVLDAVSAGGAAQDMVYEEIAAIMAVIVQGYSMHTGLLTVLTGITGIPCLVNCI